MAKKEEKSSTLRDATYLFTNAYFFWCKCVKPSKKEVKKILAAEMIGVLAVGLLGYAIKLIHIPINNIIVNN